MCVISGFPDAGATWRCNAPRRNVVGVTRMRRRWDDDGREPRSALSIRERRLAPVAAVSTRRRRGGSVNVDAGRPIADRHWTTSQSCSCAFAVERRADTLFWRPPMDSFVWPVIFLGKDRWDLGMGLSGIQFLWDWCIRGVDWSMLGKYICPGELLKNVLIIERWWRKSVFLFLSLMIR